MIAKKHKKYYYQLNRRRASTRPLYRHLWKLFLTHAEKSKPTETHCFRAPLHPQKTILIEC